MGRRHRTRGLPIDGVVFFDKPSEVSSNQAVQRVKRLFNARKVGHTGTLDVLATGVLPLCFGEATKFAQVGLDADKTYEVVARLGIATDTGDANGQVVSKQAVPKLEQDTLERAISVYRGELQQVPSMFSSLKRDGKPLYKLARKGIEVERQARTITIFSSELQEFGDEHMKLQVSCSKGTYIRTLVEDIGRDLGCGAHVTSLRRLKVGKVAIAECVTLDELLDAKQNGTLMDHMKPVSTMVEDWFSVKLPVPIAYLVMQGQSVAAPPQSPSHGWVKLLEESACGEFTFFGIGEISGGQVAPRRLVTSTH